MKLTPVIRQVHAYLILFQSTWFHNEWKEEILNNRQSISEDHYYTLCLLFARLCLFGNVRTILTVASNNQIILLVYSIEAELTYSA